MSNAIHVSAEIPVSGSDIIIHDSCESFPRAPAESIIGEVDHKRILLFTKDKKVVEVFRGREFDEEEWKKKMTAQGKTRPYLDNFQIAKE